MVQYIVTTLKKAGAQYILPPLSFTHLHDELSSLFLKFIDGRLDLLNSGEGFSDIFEEEISMGEYAGESQLEQTHTHTHHQYFLFKGKSPPLMIFL